MMGVTMFVGLLGLVLFFAVLLGIGVAWNEVSLNEAGVLVAVWLVCLAACLSSGIQPLVYWLGAPTVLLNGYLVLRVFKHDPAIPRSWTGSD